MSDLLPCPFCGNPPKTKEWVQGHHDAMRVWCDECSVETRCQGVKSIVVEKWNTRADIASEREKKLREAVRDLLKSMEQIRALTYNPSYESTGLEFGIATDALKKHAPTIKECE